MVTPLCMLANCSATRSAWSIVGSNLGSPADQLHPRPVGLVGCKIPPHAIRQGVSVLDKPMFAQPQRRSFPAHIGRGEVESDLSNPSQL